MTFEELKAEADRQGYNLIKRHKYIKLLPCKECGRKPKQWSGYGGIFYKCDCGNESEQHKRETQAKRLWNLAQDPDWSDNE